MALTADDYYLILSDGLYAGDVAEPITLKEKLTRILSDGLLALAPSPIPVTEIFKYGIKKFQSLRWGFKQNWKGR